MAMLLSHIAVTRQLRGIVMMMLSTKYGSSRAETIRYPLLNARCVIVHHRVIQARRLAERRMRSPVAMDPHQTTRLLPKPLRHADMSGKTGAGFCHGGGSLFFPNRKKE